MRYTLLADGTSDKALIQVINWLLLQHPLTTGVIEQWADPQVLPRTRELDKRIDAVLKIYPCDVLFIHRDAEREPPENRVKEIETAILNRKGGSNQITYSAVIPVRMTEAWFLFDEVEKDLRYVADNPRGRARLDMPGTKNLESLPDPKAILRGLLRLASELPARRLKNFGEGRRFQLLAERIQDFSPLRELAAFNALESDVARIVRENNW